MNIDKANPLAIVRTIDHGMLRVYEDTKWGQEVPLIVVDANGVQIPCDYYDVSDIKLLIEVVLPAYSASGNPRCTLHGLLTKE